MKIKVFAALCLAALACAGCQSTSPRYTSSQGEMTPMGGVSDDELGGTITADGAPPSGIVDYREILSSPGLH